MERVGLRAAFRVMIFESSSTGRRPSSHPEILSADPPAATADFRPTRRAAGIKKSNCRYFLPPYFFTCREASSRPDLPPPESNQINRNSMRVSLASIDVQNSRGALDLRTDRLTLTYHIAASTLVLNFLPC